MKQKYHILNLNILLQQIITSLLKILSLKQFFRNTDIVKLVNNADLDFKKSSRISKKSRIKNRKR